MVSRDADKLRDRGRLVRTYESPPNEELVSAGLAATGVRREREMERELLVKRLVVDTLFWQPSERTQEHN